ncbi:MAG: trypsin-like peptidase domain-containing protein [Oscillospiraceae bacterium]|nr:trypsin-like peptidase domain-containing protein [Oscillospiraceae bacterium]
MSETQGIYKLLCSIQCGDERGSGIQIAPDLILTVDHVVTPFFISNSPVTVAFEGDDHPINCTVISSISESTRPLALLKMPDERNLSLCTFGDDSFTEGITARAYGFFPSDTQKADSIVLTHVRSFDDTDVEQDQYNTAFNPSGERRSTFKGFSGAPIFLNGHVVGMLVSQTEADKTANRLHGICGLRFRSLLSNLGIQCTVERNDNSAQSPNTPIVSLQAVDPVYVSEMDIVLSELFEPIRNDRENGELLKSQKELRDFLNRLPDRTCSGAKKAEFYYIGAIWMLLDRHPEEAAKYYQEAKNADSHLDDSVYRAYLFLDKGQIEDAKAIIKPIDSTQKLNAYLTCLATEKASLNTVKAVVDATSLTLDKHTYRLLALAALQSDCFAEGHEYIKSAASGIKLDIELSLIDALLYYWSAMNSIYPDADRMSFAFVSNYYFYPNKNQKEDLLAAYGILEEVYERKSSEVNPSLRAKVAWSLIVVSNALPGKDREFWLANFRKCSYLNPLDIIYCVSNKINIPEKMCDDFIALDVTDDKTGMRAFAKLELLTSMGEFEQAKIFFNDHKELIATYVALSVEECELLLLLDCKEYSSAAKMIKKIQLLPDRKERYEIGIQNASNSRVFNPLVKKAITLALQTRLTVDFRNAIIICRKHNKWTEIIKVAKEWWRATGELAALEHLAEAHYCKDDFPKCLKVVEQAEELGDSSTYIRQHKLNSLIALAKFEDARTIASSFENLTTNARLTVVQARTYISEGQPQKAIQVLRSYADQDLYDLEVYQLLIELIQGDRPDMAYHYALLLHQHNPENEQISKFAGMVAIMTGHDHSALSQNLSTLLYKDMNEGRAVRAATFDEIQEVMREQQEHNERLDESYRGLECSIHMVTNPDSNVFGGFLWSIQTGASPYYGRFGVNKDLHIDYNLPLLLDYTTCLTMCKLNLFEKVCEAFKTIWLSNHLFEIWISDINKLKNVQTSVVQKDIRLSKALLELSFNDFQLLEPISDDIPYAPYDYLMLQCAKTNGAYIVEDHPVGSISGNLVPSEWDDNNLQPHDFYAALDTLHLPHPDYDDAKVNHDVVAQVKPQCKLILGNQVLTELLEANALSIVFSLFDIYLPESLTRAIHDKADAHEKRSNAAQWLDESRKLVATLYEDKKVSLKPVVASKGHDDNPYIQLLYDELSIAIGTSVTFIVDDRLCSGYYQIGSRKKKSRVFTTFDLVSALHRDNLIDTSEYYNLIDGMLSMGYSFFVPPSEYLVNRLSLSQCNADGILEEYDQLINVRRSVAFALSQSFGVRKDRICASNVSEFAGYTSELFRTFNDTLQSVWSIDQPNEWRYAASNWLLTHLGDFMCDISLSSNSSEDHLVDQQLMLISNIIAIPEENKLEYIRWIEPYLLATWCMTPELVKKASQKLVNRLDDIDLKEANYSNALRMRAEIAIVGFVLSLPNMLLNEVLKTPRFAPYKEYAKPEAITGFSRLPDISTCIERTTEICKDAILAGDLNEYQIATEFILSDIANNSEEFICMFPVETVYYVDSSVNNSLAHFFAALSYYFPLQKRAHLHELKRTLSIRMNR